MRISVTNRIKEITKNQPRGGYLPLKMFTIVNYHDDLQLLPNENIHHTLIGLAVDYLTRLMIGELPEKAFKISLLGARIIKSESIAKKLLKKIKGLDDKSIINACKLSGFDVCYRKGKSFYQNVEEIEPNSNTVNNIRTLANRCLRFFEDYGSVVYTCPMFVYKYVVGDGDFITKDALWDIKNCKDEPDKNDTLQLLMYYIMSNIMYNNLEKCKIGANMIEKYKNIQNIGFMNPKLNKIYILKTSDIPQDIIDVVIKEVLEYKVEE